MDKSKLIKRIQTLTNPLSAISIDHPTKLQQLENIKCVAFDFYGTMFISGVGDIGVDEEQEKDSSGHFTEALKKAGFSILHDNVGSRGIELFEVVIKHHRQRAQCSGIAYPEPDITAVWHDVLEQLKEEKSIKGKISRKKATLFGIEFEFRINDIWPVKDLENVLNQLLDRGLTLGIISNSQFYTPIAFKASLGKSPEKFGFHSNLLIWSFEAQRKKPSRDFYRLFVDAALKESIKPEEVLYVGNDIRKDIQPAKELGMKTALYVGDERSIRHKAKELEQPEFAPDLIIDDLQQILECL